MGRQRLACIAICLLMAQVLVACADSSAPRSESQPQPTAGRPTSETAGRSARRPRADRSNRTTAQTPERQVRYTLKGSAKRADILFVTYVGERGEAAQAEVKLPWTKTFSARDGEFLYVAGHDRTDSGTLTCEIRVEDKLLQRSEISEANGVASCSGEVGGE